MTPRPFLVLLTLLGLAGCASSPSPAIEYYLLTPPVTARDSVIERPDQPTLVIESVDLAAYLKQSGMIIQTGDHQLQVSRTHLWAESLDLALPKALVRALQHQSDQYSYYLKNVDWVGQTDYRLRLRIDSLQATDHGEVVSAGRFQLISASDTETPVFVDFAFRRDLQQDGYSDAVSQISALIGEIAAAIIDSLNEMAETKGAG